MISPKTQASYFLIFCVVLAILCSTTTITTTITPLEPGPNYVINQFIGQDIRSNETLLSEVKMAIDHVWFQKEHQELELRRKVDTIDTKFNEWSMKKHRIINKLKYFFRALSIYKAGALIDSIEKKLRSKEPQLCNRCLQWDHPENNCTKTKPRFLAWDNVTIERKEGVYTQMNHWYWILEHRRDDVYIGRISDYLEKVYHNFTTLFTPEEKPENIEQLKLIFCLALIQIQNWRYNELDPYYDDNFLEQLKVKKISLDKSMEIFFSAVGKWVNFEQYASYRRNDESTAETMATSSLDIEVSKLLKVFISEDIRNNETLLNQVKMAIEHVLSEKQRLQIQVSIKDEIIRKKTKEMDEFNLDLYETKIKTISDELWIYKITRYIKKPEHNESDEQNPLLCSNCLTWNHTEDDCNFSKVTFGSNHSTSDVYSWYRMLEHPHQRDYRIKFLLKTLQKQYNSGNFPKKLKPKPENFQQFKLMFCKALDEIHRYVDYSLISCSNEPQMKECNLYGVPLNEYGILAFLGSELPNELALMYDYNTEKSDSDSDSSCSVFQW